MLQLYLSHTALVWGPRRTVLLKGNSNKAIAAVYTHVQCTHMYVFPDIHHTLPKAMVVDARGCFPTLARSGSR